jgi:alpha-L-rhamnosidase
MSRPLPPTGLLTDLLRNAVRAGVGPSPRFSWLVRGADQTACQARVIQADAILWDSGRVAGVDPVIGYAGPPLIPGNYSWNVRTWGSGPDPSPWSGSQDFRVDPAAFARLEPPALHREPAIHLEQLPDGAWLADFGRDAFARPVLHLPPGRLIVHAGERRSLGRVDRHPPGTIRCRSVEVETCGGETPVPMPPDKRNTTSPGVLVPTSMPEVAPFRWVEIEGLTTEPAGGAVMRDVLRVPLDRGAADFRSDDPALDAVWRLCADTVDATTFLGIFVDGDRERIAYEGDAWINQLSHHALDRTPASSRATIDHLLRFPTWPTEWQLHMPLMAEEDWMWTGDATALQRWRDDLAVRTLVDLVREDGLISTHGTVPADLLHRLRLDRIADLVDWPPGSFTAGGTGERDGHEMPPVNTVVNAFHIAACRAMARIDQALGRPADAWLRQADAANAALNRLMWSESDGAYVDGIGSSHCAQHSSLFPLAFGLIPEERIDRTLDHVVARGMACSVYAAQHLLDGLYRHHRPDQALDLITARHDRGWLRMLEAGSTMTLEAWDWRYKNNLDWNHAWATAPLNVCARWVLGVQTAAPGGAILAVHPQPGRLRRVEGRVPSMRGSVDVALRQEPGVSCEMELELPCGSVGEVSVPWNGEAAVAWLDGVQVTATVNRGRIACGRLGSGRHHVLVRARERRL